MTVASMVILRAFITLVNINSKMVKVLGFIRLGRTPNARNGAESTPRSGTGRCICSQQPLQILDCCNVMNGAAVGRSRRVSAYRKLQSAVAAGKPGPWLGANRL